jgi:hypothetical protein
MLIQILNTHPAIEYRRGKGFVYLKSLEAAALNKFLYEKNINLKSLSTQTQLKQF